MAKSSKKAENPEMRGTGYEALLACVVLQAVADSTDPKKVEPWDKPEKIREDAISFLDSPALQWALESLDIDYYEFVAALEYRVLIGGTGTRAHWDNKQETKKAA